MVLVQKNFKLFTAMRKKALYKFPSPKFYIYFFAGLATIRFIVALVAAFRPITSPHVWRQVDTLSVAFRYWQRFSLEENHALWFFPAILNSADTYGYMLMEFPLLNLLLSPAFMFGIEIGRIIAHVLLVLLVVTLGMSNFRIWQRVRLPLFGENRMEMIAWASALFPFFSFCSGFTFKCIPDVISVQLVILSLGLLLRNHLGVAIFCAVLGCLMKPVSIFAFGFFAIFFIEGRKSLSLKVTGVFCLCAVSTLYYYGKFLPSFAHLIELEGKFAVNPRSFLVNILSLKNQSWLSVLDFFNFHFFVPWALVVLLFFNYKKLRLRFVLGMIALQLLAVILVDGSHAFVHAYYFSCAAPLATYLFFRLLGSNQVLGAIILILTLVRTSENIAADFKNFDKSSKVAVMFDECEKFKLEHAEFPWGRNYVFRSSEEMYPLLGLCFGERQDSKKSQFGFFYLNDNLPSDCLEISRQREIKIVRCTRVM